MATEVRPVQLNWTRRQREVLDLLTEGLTNGQIAERLGLTLYGAKWHVSEVLTKLGVSSREDAAEYWRRERGIASRGRRALAGLSLPFWPAFAGAVQWC